MAGPDAADRMADRRRPPVAVADPVTEQAHRYTDTDTDTRRLGYRYTRKACATRFYNYI